MAILSYRQQCSHDKLLFARKMRKHPTPAEKTLWQMLRCKKLGFSFRRQAIILGYIVDFYCPKARLIIECDGNQHDHDRDTIRDKAMVDKDFTILRFSNNDVTYNLTQTLEIIHNSLTKNPLP